MKKLTLFVLSLVLVAVAQAQTITPQILQQAKSMGVTDAQIDQAIKGKGATGQTGNVADSTFGQQAGLRIVEPYGKSDLGGDVGGQTGQAGHYNIHGGWVVPDENTVFGTEIFNLQKLSFEPNFNMPTPDSYVLSAGDELLIDLWGNSEVSFTRKITPDGLLVIPSAGVVFLSGKTVEQARDLIREKMSEVYSELKTGGINMRVSLGQIRSITVNIAGEAAVPGTYTLPSLATLFNAIYMAGGVNPIGSLRDITVYRNNKPVAHLDVYDYIINGKYESNITLEDNDMIVINPYRNHVKISGKVKRNRIFELKEGETLADLIRYAGDFTGDAYSENLAVSRKSGRFYQMYTVDDGDFSSFAMKDGDSVRVDSVIDVYENRLSIRGAVWRPGYYQLSDEVNTVKKLIEKAEGLRNDAYFGRGILRRQKKDHTYRSVAVDVPGILDGTVEDIPLQQDDDLFIPYQSALREKYYITVRGEVNGIKEVEDTAQVDRDIQAVKEGKSVSPTVDKGQYRLDYMEGMTPADAILLAGGFKESASQTLINVVRRTKDPLSITYDDSRAEVFELTLENGLAIDKDGLEFILEPFDEVIVRRSPAFVRQKFVGIDGEVLFSGSYNMTKNMRLSDLVKVSGGFTPYAYVKGAQLRRPLSKADMAKIEAKARMLEASNGKDSLSTNLLEMPEYYVVGINLDEALEKVGGQADVILQEGDELVVPMYSSVVKISGAVVYPNAVTYEKKKKLKDYIRNAGGYAQNARRKAYVVYANGQVETVRGGIFRRYPKIEPGCEIIVPMKTPGQGLSLPEIMSLTSSTTSIAALINSMIK